MHLYFYFFVILMFIVPLNVFYSRIYGAENYVTLLLYIL